MTEQVCSCCKAELVELVFSTRWVVFLCDDHLCRLYRERQGYRRRQEGDLSLCEIRLQEQEAPKAPDSQLVRKRPSEYPGYARSQARQMENYREARRLGATPAQAQAGRTEKGFRSLVAWLGQQKEKEPKRTEQKRRERKRRE